MKIIVPFLLLLLFSLQLFSASSNYQPRSQAPVPDFPIFFEGMGKISTEEFLDLSPKEIRQRTGKRFGWKKSLGLKAAQKKIRKNMSPSNGQKEKSQVTALFLAIFLGFFGVHRFYLGYHGYGVLILLTLGLYGILGLIDVVLIATGNLHPKNGVYTESLD